MVNEVTNTSMPEECSGNATELVRIKKGTGEILDCSKQTIWTTEYVDRYMGSK